MRRTLAGAVVLAALLPVALWNAAPAGAEASHTLIQGSGSSWSSNAVNQWIADVEPNGLQVVFTASGSAQGRKDFAYDTTDFAVSDIGYQGKDTVSGQDDTSQGRVFAYLPVVAGGTSFPYQIRVGGQLVRNLRLSGLTLAKIFTNKITDWSDPAITADNNGHALPSLPIIPVVHSEGSGSTAQFTRYLDKQYPALWRPYFGGPGLTEYYPRQGSQIAQNGSDGVINFVTSSSGNGSIGYDEYSYALNKDYPVAKVENAAGYFTAPTQYNVAVALTQAQINMDKSSPDYLLQNLDKVYTYDDQRTYPLSSYSYMIIPTGATDSRMTTAKRQTLADFLYYSVCQGQAEMGPIGYSPLPVNLVQASFDQVAKLKQADAKVDLTNRDVSTCDNPTFVAGQPSRNYLAEIAPQPPACDKAGAGPCTADQGLTNGNPAGGKPSSAGGTTTKTTTQGSAPAAPAGSRPGGAARAPGGGPTGVVNAPAAVDPVTGQVVAAGPATTTLAGGETSSAGALTTVPTALLQRGLGGSGPVLGVWAALLLLGLVAGPPLLRTWLLARKGAR
jgi:phosphate ABC transporter phosphate-binding protein